MDERQRQPLSEREKEILALLATGATNQEIARALHISPNTVKVHLRNIYAKLDVMNRSEAILVGLQEGIITLPGVDTGTPLPTPPPVPVAVPHLTWVIIGGLLAGLLTVILLLWYPAYTHTARGRPAALLVSDLGRGEGALPHRRDLPRWLRQTPLSIPLARMATATWQGRVFTFGGETPDGVTAATFVYDPARGVWASAASKPTPVSNAQAVRVGDRIFVFGGTTETFTPTSRVEIYDPVQDRWEQGTPMPHPVAGYALARWKGRIFLFGGWDGHAYLTSVYAYDPEEDRWAVLPPMSAPRAFAVAATLGDVIYVIGGYDGQADVPDVWAFDPNTLETGGNPWSQLQPLLSPRGGAGVAVSANAIYVIGGGMGLTVEGAERYDVTTDTWARIETPYGPNWRHMGVAVIGGDILTIGGWAGAHLPYVERYQASFRNFIPYGPVHVEEGGK